MSAPAIRSPRPVAIELAGVPVDLVQREEAVRSVARRMRAAEVPASSGPALAVVSVNVDHVHHFGRGGRWHGSLDRAGSGSELDWFNLIDGAPVASQAARITGSSWPRIAGSDLIGPLLDEAERTGASVGFLGGSEETHSLLRERMERDRPALAVSGYWAPARDDLGDPISSRALADRIRESGTDVLVVGFGKPRQEVWIAEYGSRTGARVFLAFGAVLDFLAGRVARAPHWVADAGLEWAWRLMLEPRRLARRYLVEGPAAYLALRRHSSAVVAPRHRPAAPVRDVRPSAGDAAPRFRGPGESADVTVVAVTYNNESDIVPLISGLRAEAGQLRLRVVVVDNGSTDGTIPALSSFADVALRHGGGNVGYAGGINASRPLWGDTGAILILNPDLTLRPGAIVSMLERMNRTGAGVVVPRLETETGQCYPSLRREPRLAQSFGDALFGSRFCGRPAAWSELDYDTESYRYAHRVEWATGAAVLVRHDIAERVGAWDERFFLYSEETDFFRRVRDTGAQVWFEPDAVMRHRQGGSGASRELIALMAVNRIRYAEKYREQGARPLGTRLAVILHEALRSKDPAHRYALKTVVRRSSWASLPAAQPARPAGPAASAGTPVSSAASSSVAAGLPAATAFPGGGAVIIPAHNEAAVIERTLAPLGPLARDGRLEVIVSCNGCTDDTAARARAVAGVRVIETAAASKTAALNAADEAASGWPRLYLDADIEIAPCAIAEVFRTLEADRAAAARPAFQYQSDGAGVLVRSYYRARSRMPQSSRALWGAGVYALSERAHQRLGVFPPVTADDLWVDRLFSEEEKLVLDTEPVLVRTPRSVSGLLAILRRTHRGNAESGLAGTGGASAHELLRSVRGPLSAWDAGVYLSFALAGRLAARRADGTWERDDSSRAAEGAIS